MKTFTVFSSLAGLAAAYPFIAELPGTTNKHLLKRQQPIGNLPGGATTCPFNPNHVPAPLVTSQFPYNNAKNGAPGNGKGGYQVPAPGDTVHQYQAPTDKDIRGPCPGLNAAANHGFLARDGIVTYNELVDAVQNVYNMGWDLANFLAIFSVYIADGDWVTKKLSLGCDATTRTSWNPSITGSQPGLVGHNKFEADASLTRNDFFSARGDNFNFNGTLFAKMSKSTGGIFDFAGLAKYRFERYQESRAENPQFFFGPLGLFQYGAASFVYELMANGKEGYIPTLKNTESFFGAKKESDGTYSHVPERIPDNWTNRVKPYGLLEVGAQIVAAYAKGPVGIGGSANGQFVGIDFPPYIKNGNFTAAKPSDFLCLVYQFITVPIPSTFNGFVTPQVNALQALLTTIGGDKFTNLGCPIPLTKRDEEE